MSVELYPGQEHFTHIPPHDATVAYATVMTECIQNSGISLQSPEGRQIMEVTAMLYQDKKAQGKVPSPKKCFVEAAWFVLTNGEEMIDTDSDEFPSVWIETTDWQPTRTIVSPLLSPGTQYVLGKAQRLINNSPITIWSVWKMPQKANEEVFVYNSPIRFSEQDILKSATMPVYVSLTIVNNPIDKDTLRNRYIPANLN